VPGGAAKPGERKLQINPGPLKVVPAAYRRAWEDLAKEVTIDVPTAFRRRWTRAETARVVMADPTESYDELAGELARTAGAVRYRRMAMIHLLRNEYDASDRVSMYRSDPKTHHKHHDYHQVDELLRDLGIYDMPVSHQLAIARPLRQPHASWRGDGTSAALSGGDELRELREEFRRISQEGRAKDGRMSAGKKDDQPKEGRK
jgi:hypothetical protein